MSTVEHAKWFPKILRWLLAERCTSQGKLGEGEAVVMPRSGVYVGA